ncbi:MAG: hypothetical protein BWY73_00889 [candidate division TA06 bacterium ADurb.Bin417]|uniref:Uncharacterized protein n=1 Tax=candidate division TA06 bacterium ADurb.Bin417 TaxID=1852828 RepID=A0A1V5MG62_UNCT6|nr:MAG: hypothetical protein BWY73_00889 [candidate division TA06 bacterium ADurb.Bin417]
MSSTRAKASSSEVFFGTISRIFSLETTTSVSSCFFNSPRPRSATSRRMPPSKPKGWVTKPTTTAPLSLAILATTGPAPVPVPPPRPRVRKTRSAPFISSPIWARSSLAANLPISGLAPVPSPSVSRRPIWSLIGAALTASAWLSVLMAARSTPLKRSTIRLTTLPPAPPTPTTLILTAPMFCSSGLILIIIIRRPRRPTASTA